MDRILRLSNQILRNSKSASPVPQVAKYKPYTTVPTDDGQFFNCSCDYGPAGIPGSLCCEVCKKNWSHKKCVGVDGLNSYSMARFFYVCFECRGIRCEEDRKQMFN